MENDTDLKNRLVAMESRLETPEPPHLQTRLYTIGLRLAFNELRRRRRRIAALGRLRPRPWQDPSDPDLAAALRSLEPRVRAALLLSVVDGYTHAEIATMVSAPTGTVASWISRARAQMRAVLERD